MAWKPFSKVIPDYLDVLENGDVYSLPKDGSVSFPLRVAAYLTFVPDEVKVERELVLKTLDILIDEGVDFTRKDPLKNQSPIDFLRKMGEDKMADYILNRSLNSATEAVAFEKINKQRIKEALSKVGTFIKNAATKPTEWVTKAAGKVMTPAASMAVGGRDNLKRIQNEVKEAKKPVKINEADYKPTTSSPEELNKKVKEYKTASEKEMFIRNALDEKLGSESRTLFARALAKESNPFTSNLYAMISKFLTIKDKTGNPLCPICPEATKIILSDRYSEIVDIFKRDLSGLYPLDNKDGPGMEQLKVIAFYCMRGWDTDNLRTVDGKWMTAGNMKKVVNKLSVSTGKAKYGSTDPTEIAKWLKRVIGPAFKLDEISEKDALSFIKGFGVEFPKNAKLTSVFITKTPKYSGTPFENLKSELQRYEKEGKR